MNERTQPHNLEAEKAVLGAVLIAPARLDDIPDLRVDDFFLPAHREIFEAMRAVSARRAALDLVSVADELKSRGMLSRLDGGERYLLECANEAPVSDNARHYARIVAERAALRRLISACAEVQSSAYGDFGDFGEFLSEARRKISSIEVFDRKDEPEKVGSDLNATLDEIADRANNPGSYFVTTGIKAFDERIGGLRGGQLIVVAARPGKGKSAFAKDVCVNNATRQVPALIFSMEMTRIEVQERVLSGRAQVNGRKLISGKLDHQEWNRLNAAAARTFDLPLWLYTKNVTAERICAIARRWFNRLPDPPDNRKKKAVVAIDYLGLVAPGDSNDDNEARELGKMTGAFKRLAVELDIPVMLLSQLNREIERATKQRKPVMSDLRASGAIEQDANMVIFPWWEGESPHHGSKDAELVVGKNRGGVTGDVEVEWWPEFTMFTDREGGAYTAYDRTGETGRTPYAD